MESVLSVYYSNRISKEILYVKPNKFSDKFTMFLAEKGGPIIMGETFEETLTKFYEAMTVCDLVEKIIKR